MDQTKGYFDVKRERYNNPHLTTGSGGITHYSIYWRQFRSFVNYKVHTVMIMDEEIASYLANSFKLDSFYSTQPKDMNFTKNDEIIKLVESIYKDRRKVDLSGGFVVDLLEVSRRIDQHIYNTEMANYLI